MHWGSPVREVAVPAAVAAVAAGRPLVWTNQAGGLTKRTRYCRLRWDLSS